MKTTPWTREEALAMHALYVGGMTLEQCAQQYGITRERVRQIFRKAELPSNRTPEQKKALRRLDAACAERAVRLYTRIGDVGAVARQLGFRRDAVREAIEEALPQHSVFRPVQKSTPKYSDDELLDLLREASQNVGGIISTHDYNSFATGRTISGGRSWPTHQTYLKRFGGWRDALLRAGLPANPSSPIRGQRIFEPGHCIDAIRRLAHELGRVPTARDYDMFAARSGGSAPSLSIIRDRCGSWHLALKTALMDFGWALRPESTEEAV